jgi:hypothetical protein
MHIHTDMYVCIPGVMEVHIINLTTNRTRSNKKVAISGRGDSRV